MKKYNKHIVLIFPVLFLIFSSDLFANTRGIKVSVETSTGKTIELYHNSYALIVGNGNYTNGWDPLLGAVRDVMEVSDALKKNGFKVELRTNLTKDKFDRAFVKFVYKHGKDINNRLLFYYAGHGYTRWQPVRN